MGRIANCKSSSLHLCLVMLVPLLAGCAEKGPDVSPVKGKVTLDGRPLPNVVLQFQPDGAKRPSGGGTDDNGEYQLYYKRKVVGARVGQHTVRILAPDNPKSPVIPERYNKQTELRADVKPSPNEINFDLKSDAK